MMMMMMLMMMLIMCMDDFLRNEHYNDDIPSFSDHPIIQTSNRQMCIKLLRVYQVALQLDLQAGMAVRFSPVAVGFVGQKFIDQGMTYMCERGYNPIIS